VQRLSSIPLLHRPNPWLRNQSPTLFRKFETVNFQKGVCDFLGIF
jgi:hypothetical protein